MSVSILRYVLNPQGASDVFVVVVVGVFLPVSSGYGNAITVMYMYTYVMPEMNAS